MSMPNDVPGAKLRLGDVVIDVRFAVVAFLGTFLPILFVYRGTVARLFPFLPQSWHGMLGQGILEMAHMQFILFFAVPILVVIFAFRDHPEDYGLAIGRWREGLIWTFSLCPAIAVVLWFTVPTGNIDQYYRAIYYGANAGGGSEWLQHGRMIYTSVLQLWGWEYLLRGFLLFGTARIIGPGPAIFLQMIPFAFGHVSKPELETMSTLFTGLGMGFIAWRTRTFLYVFLIHCFILVFANLMASGVFSPSP
ncbi:MAG: abortive infection protein [Candidatus Hydrogenedentota bacterium]